MGHWASRAKSKSVVRCLRVMGMWGILWAGLVPTEVAIQTFYPIYRHKRNDSSIVTAAALFGHHRGGELVEFVVDNAAVVAVLNATYSKDLHLMHLVRVLVFFASISGHNMDLQKLDQVVQGCFRAGLAPKNIPLSRAPVLEILQRFPTGSLIYLWTDPVLFLQLA